MTKAAANKTITSLLVLGLVAVSGDAFAKPSQKQKQAKASKAKRVHVAKAKTSAASVVNSVVIKTNPAVAKTAEPPNPDALLASLSTNVTATPKSGSVDALVAKACALGSKPVAKHTKGSKKAGAKLAYMHSLNRKASTLGFAPIVRVGVKPKGQHMVVRMKDRPLADKVVRKVVRAKRRDVTSCHESSAVRGKAPRGNVTLRFSVAASGKVASVKVIAGGNQYGAFERCLEGRIRGWQFPKGETVTKVDYPYTLQ